VDGSRVSATNLVGLILAVVLSIFLIAALVFPERF
jgi:K+-transporting ATPase KdpF subunit